MTVLVVGRTGQLARSLAASSHPLAPSLRFAGRPEVDLSMTGSVAALIAWVRPRLVINAAAYTEVDQAEVEPALAFRINAEAAGEIAAAATVVGAGVLQLSTDYVFGGASDVAYDEMAAIGPLNVYGGSKLAGENAVRAVNDRHVIVRTSWLVSAHGKNFVRTMLKLAEDRDEIGVVADQFGRPTVVPDLAFALLDIASRWEAVEPGTYHIAGGGEPASWADLAEEVMRVRRDALGAAPLIRRISTGAYPTPAARPAYSVLDCGKSRQMLGIELPGWREAVAGLTADLLEKGTGR